MDKALLPALTRRVARLPVATVTWLERVQQLLSSRMLVILVAHYYERDIRRSFDRASLDANLEYLSKECHVMPLREALRRLEEGKPLPRRAASLVVDDAAGPFYGMGWPALRAAGVPFSLGVIPGMIRAETTEHLVARIMYGVTSIEADDQRREMLVRAHALVGDATRNDEPNLERLFDALRSLGREDLVDITGRLGTPHETYMTWEQLAELRSKGVDLVPHSMSHPRFCHVTGTWLAWELSRSAELIGEHTNEAVDTFVFPYGNPRCVTEPVRAALKRHGYRYGIVTRAGITTPQSDRYLLPRVDAEVPPEEFARNVDRRRWAFAGRRATMAARDPLARATVTVAE